MIAGGGGPSERFHPSAANSRRSASRTSAHTLASVMSSVGRGQERASSPIASIMATNLTGQISLATLDSLSRVLDVQLGDLIERVSERRGRGK